MPQIEVSEGFSFRCGFLHTDGKSQRSPSSRSRARKPSSRFLEPTISSGRMPGRTALCLATVTTLTECSARRRAGRRQKWLRKSMLGENRVFSCREREPGADHNGASPQNETPAEGRQHRSAIPVAEQKSFRDSPSNPARDLSIGESREVVAAIRCHARRSQWCTGARDKACRWGTRATNSALTEGKRGVAGAACGS